MQQRWSPISIQLEPNLESAYFGLGEVYQSQNETEKAIMMYKKVITLNPSHQDAYYQIDKIYRGREMYEEAIAFYENARKEYPNSEWPLRFLSTYYYPSVYSQKLISTANNISDNYFTLITKNNYLMVYQLLNKNNVTLIAMQYPMRPVEDLMKLFQGNENIIFISNEHNFKKALLNSNYQELFVDLFAGDFGHTTDFGNKLIAENVANHIFEYLEIESKNEKNNN